ncbi:PTS sugar transporter subunit IIB [Enterococcus sp. BWB1-3]|uniref:PTS sugar transporter subunit IIB n=1 Tax=unclassified Enterococcus TaxID=2608891 RepID=UPI0019242226|nr:MULTISPECIES: PTS sugar transporter subunit IIB [unclassified Enterococcus]MBL1229100.1 PTS sugar transporter subunit IIB [Enterococcus sp. BWB1-3]MCB5953485.1 PTS sugar transporter subunit IIB [Enterococcus sp. CWB-B31]
MQKKRIYVCCGSGIATSTVIAKKVKEALDNNGIPYTLDQCTVQQISSKVATLKPDLIVSSAQITTDVKDVPIVMGRSFLTGIKKQETIDEIISILKS